MKIRAENAHFAKPVPENAEDLAALHDACITILHRVGLTTEPATPKALPQGVVYSTDPAYGKR